MPARKRTARPRIAAPRPDASVDTFLAKLEHPRKREIEAVRRLILTASPEIREEVKWNAPSYRTSEFFATIGVRARDRVQLILHRGAKVKDDSTDGMRIPDPAGLLQWLAKERCLVTLADAKDIEERGAALQTVVRAWIRQL